MSEPKPMNPEDLDDLRREVECGNLGEAIGELLDAHDFWRSRVSVDVCDLEREGVGLAKVTAWLRAYGWTLRPWDGTQWDDWAKNGERVDVPRSALDGGVLAASVCCIAEAEQRSQWDILAEIAAMEVSGG